MAVTFVIPTIDYHDRVYEAVSSAMEHADCPTNEYMVIDNGSDTSFSTYLTHQQPLPYPVRNIVNAHNIGVPQAYIQGIREATHDVVVFTHADVIMFTRGWDSRIAEAYARDPKLAISGFFSALGIGYNGGRIHPVSNMQGKRYGSNWRDHGSHNDAIVAATVLDGLSMHFKRSVWLDIIQHYSWLHDAPIHHFYDKYLPLLAIFCGYHCAGIGIAFDHGLPEGMHPISSVSEKYKASALAWLDAHNIPYSGQHDKDIYDQAEKMMFTLFGAYFPIIVRDISDGTTIQYHYLINATM